MRILTLHATHFRRHWAREHDVRSFGFEPDCELRPRAAVTSLADVLRQLPAGWTPDLVFLGDDGRLLRVVGLEDAPCPTAILALEAAWSAAWQAPLAAACDVAFVAQRDLVPAFADAGAPAPAWLPPWAPDDVSGPGNLHYGVAFVGSLDRRIHPDRVALLDQLRAHLPLYVAEGARVPVVRSARIVVDQTSRGELTRRAFEAMGCGALLLAERSENGLLDLFRDREHLVTYPRGDAAALIDLARQALGNERARAAIAERGRAAVVAGHREEHRAATVLARIAATPARGAGDTRRLKAARAYTALAQAAGRLAAAAPRDHAYPALHGAYLAAATALATAPSMPEIDRRAILGRVALERTDLGTAESHLAAVAAAGGTVEDHLARIENLVRLGDVQRALAAIETLRSVHPDYSLAETLAQQLGGSPRDSAGSGE